MHRFSARFIPSIAAVALALPGAAPAASLVNTFGGPSGYGPAGSCLKRNDDGFSAAINVTPAFPTGLNFFGTTYNDMYVNTNGSISFSSGISTFTPSAFPGAPQPMIAPFWADVDTRRTVTDGPNGNDPSTPTTACGNDTEDEVWWALDAAGGRVVVTWHRVGYYRMHMDKRMDFQLILSKPTACSGAGGAGNFDVEFRFAQCEWETGDASGGSGGFGGTPAQSGFDSGQATWNGNPGYVSLPGSRSNGIAAALCAGSNLSPAQAGVWRFEVRGGAIQCPNAGAPCTVPGKSGVCAQGLTNCVGSGTACVQVTQPSPETCNGLDDDCDGQVDDGAALCGAGGQVCARGVCVDPCFEGGCPTGYSCTAGDGCVESACATVTCSAGQICRGGTCVGPCDGVTCPLAQVCRIGKCVDPCAGVTCSGTTPICEAGVCVSQCPCRTCPTGKECAASGACVAPGCGAVTCGAGTVCQAGACVDACTGAACPAGQACQAGACVDLPPDAGAGGGSGGGTGGTGGTGGGTGASGGGSAGGGLQDGGSGGGSHTTVSSTGGCSCQSGLGAPLLLALAGLAALARRRSLRREP